MCQKNFGVDGSKPMLEPVKQTLCQLFKGLNDEFCDLNGDGKPDLYVCNDFQSPDRIWLNEGGGGLVRFRAAPPAMASRRLSVSI